MQTHVEFRSDQFPAYDGEEEQINPGLWGKRLAEFLRENLRKEGFETEESIAEDWGWMVPVTNEQFRLWIGCGHYQEYPDGFLCFIEPHTPFVRKLLKKIDTQPRVASLQRAIDKVLSEAPAFGKSVGGRTMSSITRRRFTARRFRVCYRVPTASSPMGSSFLAPVAPAKTGRNGADSRRP